MGRLYNSRVFCYPYGGVSEVTPRVVARVRQSAFTHALANIQMPLTGEKLRYSDYFIPRFTLPNTDKAYLLSFILSGTNYFLHYRRLLPKWDGLPAHDFFRQD